MAGIIGIYGLVVSVLIANNLSQQVPLYTSLVQLGAGLAVGLAGLAAGYVSQAILICALELTRNPVSPLVSSETLVSAEQPSSQDSTSA
jgi:F0F1-type ATP synthase membrane subunit c/vacuolar-type H+-ATPase subunit K